MARRVVAISLIVVALGAVAAAVVALVAARRLYVQSKVTLAEPVRLHVYAEKNLAAAEQSTGPAGSRRPRLVLIGDSRVQQWTFTSEDWEVHNRGIGGETSAQLRLRLDQDALALEPDVVVVQAGVNDLLAAALAGPRGRVIARRTPLYLQEVAERAAAAGAQVILLTVIPPAKPTLLRRLVWHDSIYRYVDRVNRELLAWTPPPGVRVVDARAVLRAKGPLSRAFARDTLHINPAGYRRLTEALMPLLAEFAPAAAIAAEENPATAEGSEAPERAENASREDAARADRAVVSGPAPGAPPGPGS